METIKCLDSDFEQLLKLLRDIHINCFRLCKLAFGKYLPIAGNIGVFCQSEKDFQRFTRVRKQITQPSNNSKQKYFRLNKVLILPQIKDIPKTTYTHLYIRKPTSDAPEAGDVDFKLNYHKFNELKKRLLKGCKIPGAKIYNPHGWNMIELSNPKINALAYISYKEMAKKARVRFD